MWHSKKKHPVPERDGLYVVARFEDGEMADWSTNYIFLKERGGWMPNNVGDPTCGVRGFTHWMSYREFRQMVETTDRED